MSIQITNDLTQNTIDSFAKTDSSNTFSSNQKVQGIVETENVVSRNLLNKYGNWNYGGSVGWDATKLTSDGKIITYSNLYASRSLGQLLNLKNNTTYTLSGTLISATGTNENNVVIEFPFSNIPDFDISKNVSKPHNFSYTFTTGNNANSIWISLNGLNNGLGSAETVFDNLQIEEGTTASPYVPYLNLEHAMKENKIYSTSERVIGTWIDGKPIYSKYIDSILINNLTNYWQDLVNIADLNIDTLVDAVLYGIGNKSKICKQGGAFFQINGNYIQTVGWSDIYGGFRGVYIEYTKTTD